jgi:hypothetical protein
MRLQLNKVPNLFIYLAILSGIASCMQQIAIASSLVVNQKQTITPSSKQKQVSNDFGF